MNNKMCICRERLKALKAATESYLRILLEIHNNFI